MTLLETTPAAPAEGTRVDDRGRLWLAVDGVERVVPPRWLLDRSDDPADVDPSTNQRVDDPLGVAPDLRIDSAVDVDGAITVEFSDGRRRIFSRVEIMRSIGGTLPADEPPRAEPWTTLQPLPTIRWTDVAYDRRHGDTGTLRRLLADLHRFGCFVITGAPTEPGSLVGIAGRFGRVSPTNFGTLFDVQSRPDPTDLAYTPVGLGAHTDQPYRRPVPGLQFLHTLVNDAPGGESIVCDALAALDALHAVDPSGFDLLARVVVEYRYDIGTDVVVDRAPAVEFDPDGRVRRFRFSPRLDRVPYDDDVDAVERYYDLRRWLAEWFADPSHQVGFKMAAGDVLVVDNHRVLHGRTPFDPSAGRRHLQGCYIDHDGPTTLWRLLARNASP